MVIPAHNEERVICSCLAAIDALDYPPSLLRVVAVDDGSRDSTVQLLGAWGKGRARRDVLELPERVGKWEAINRAMDFSSEDELVFICDADLRVRPDCLRELVGAFGDHDVAAAAAYLSPENASSGALAYYAAVESWVHQLVTSSAKDRLDLCPPTLGASLFQRSAIREVGGFLKGVPGGDVTITVDLMRSGWRTRFVRWAVADNSVADRWGDYWHQRTRWGRSVLGSIRRRDAPRRGRPGVRELEAILAATGYSDRAVLGCACVLLFVRALPAGLPLTYAGIRVLEVVVALVKARAPSPGRYVVALPGLFVYDVLASFAAMYAHVGGRSRAWSRPQRRVGRGFRVERSDPR